MNLKIPFFLCAALSQFLLHVHADRGIDLVHDEDLIPFYATLVKDLDTDAGRLRSGDRVVVIRPVDPEHVRVNASRKGVATVPLHATNLTAEIRKIKQGNSPSQKLVPRMSFFLANRIASGKSGWQDTIRGERVYECKRWLLLYGDASAAATSEAVVAASGYYADLPETKRYETMFVYMDVTGKKDAIQQLAEKSQPSIECMPGYLSKGYSTSLDHIDGSQDLPQLVEVASSGRILEHLSGLAAIKHWLSEQ